MPSDRDPSPRLFSQTITAYERTAILSAALELDVFSALAGERLTAGELARRCDASERGVRILCDSLTAMGFLTKDDGRYAATPDTAALLDSSSPGYIGAAEAFLRSPRRLEGFDRLAEAVRRGGTVLSGDGVLGPEDPMWVTFAHAMAPMADLHARALVERIEPDRDRPIKVLDVAAGHGLYGIAFAEAHPGVEVVAVDWPNVLEVAAANAAARRVADRHQLRPGSALEVDLGKGYDLALMTGFLHLFDRKTCERLLSRVHDALAPGGRAVNVDFIPDADKTSPPPTATFAAVMLVTTPAGDAYSFAELEAMASRAGFVRSELRPLDASPLKVTVSFKAAQDGNTEAVGT